MMINVSDLLWKLETSAFELFMKGDGKLKPEGVKRVMNEVTTLTGRVATWSLVRFGGVLAVAVISRIANSCNPAISGVG